MTAEQITLLIASGAVLLAAVAYLCARKSGYHRGKQEVYEEFAATYGAMSHVVFVKDKQRRKIESRRLHMRLALVDPSIRDGLRSALETADEHWGNS